MVTKLRIPCCFSLPYSSEMLVLMDENEYFYFVSRCKRCKRTYFIGAANAEIHLFFRWISLLFIRIFLIFTAAKRQIFRGMNNQIIIYQTEDGQTRVDVRMENETVWLTQAQMASLFDKDQSVIARHIANVFKEGELDKESNMQILHNTLSKYKPTAIYNLDVIISVGYRVKSQRGVKFRQWANSVLKQYLVKGYAVNDRLRRDQLGELRQLVQVVGRTLQHQDITSTADGQALFDVVVDYTYARISVA